MKKLNKEPKRKEYDFKKIMKLIIRIIGEIILGVVLYILFDTFLFKIINLKLCYILLYIIIIIFANIEEFLTLIEESNKKSSELFNVYYINYSKVFEICMLIDNKIKSKIEKTYKDEYTKKDNANITGEVLNLGANIFEENSNTKSYEYKELQEIKNTNSTFLDILLKKCKSNPENIQDGDLIRINDVKLEIINKEEIAQVNSMISGVFNGNTIPSSTGDSTLNINVSAISNILLKDYKYHLLCKSTIGKEFYISIPMKANKEFENDYSIYDLEIGTVDIIGIYKTKLYDYKNHIDTFNYLQNLGNNNYESTGEELISSNKEKIPMKKKENGKKPYIDLIAIIQKLNIKGDDEKDD